MTAQHPDWNTYHPSTDLLAGRIVLITGATRGIGRTLAVAAARHGATTILTGRRRQDLDSVASEIDSLGAPTPDLVQIDLTRAVVADYDAVAANVMDRHGKLDGLVHNAGMLGAKTPIEHYDPMTWSTVLHVNLSAPFLLTRALFPMLKASDDASVIFTSSGVGRTGRAYWGAYAVSKFGTEGLMQVLADETRANAMMRVNCINPGATRTGMRREAYPAEDPNTLPTPADIMAPYLYLLGPDSRGVTGESLDAQA